MSKPPPTASARDSQEGGMEKFHIKAAADKKDENSHVSESKTETDERNLATSPPAAGQCGNGHQMVRPQAMIEAVQKGEKPEH